MYIYQKTIGTLAVLFVLACMASCSDDEEQVTRQEQVVGTWSLSSQKVTNIEVTTVVGGIPITLPVSDIPFISEEQKEILDTLKVLPEDVVFVFEADQTYTANSASAGSSALTGDWSLSDDGQQLTLTGLDQASQVLGTNSLTFTIQSFTGSAMSLLASVNDISLDQFGVSELQGASISGDYQLDLEKQ